MKKIKILLGLIILAVIIFNINVNSAFVLKKSTYREINAYKNNNLVRLHVVANSNSLKDQYIKRKVRNEIQIYMNEINGVISLNDQIELQKLKGYIEEILRAEGYNYPARVNYGNYYFPLRTYNDLTLPAGKYKALKVVLGKGEGSNWWCVLLPPMCVENRDNSEGNDLDIEIRFKALEWFNENKKIKRFLQNIFNVNEREFVSPEEFLERGKFTFRDKMILSRVFNNIRQNNR